MTRRQNLGPVAASAYSASLLLGVACMGPGAHGEAHFNEQIPPLATASILAPVPAFADTELARLERLGDDPALLLRRAFILLETGEARRAMQLNNQVLYGVNSPSPAEEALALYLRCSSYLALGEGENAARDRDRALELALDEELRRRLRAALPTPALPSPEPTNPILSVLPRSAWLAGPERPSRLNAMGRIYRLTIHHSAMRLDNPSTSAAADAIFQIQRNHQRDQGYGDIGYHFMIDPAGRIWSARDISWQGAHARAENNRGNVGVCLLGNFVPGGRGQTPSPYQVRTLQAFTAWLCDRYRIPVEQIYTHREMVATECPGGQLQVVVDQMRRQMRDLALASPSALSRKRGK